MLCVVSPVFHKLPLGALEVSIAVSLPQKCRPVWFGCPAIVITGFAGVGITVISTGADAGERHFPTFLDTL